MKRYLILTLTLCLMAVLLCVGVLAADVSDAGVYVDSAEAGVTLTKVETKDSSGYHDAASSEYDSVGGTALGKTVTFYTGKPERLTIHAANASSGQYLVIAQTTTAAPSESNIAYIDQQTGEDGGLDFVVYPNSWRLGDYYIYLADSTGRNLVMTIKYYAPYTLGDVNNDGEILPGDASLILQYYAELLDEDDFATRNLSINAADVNGDGDVLPGDASLVLQRFAELLDENFKLKT